MKHKGTRRRRGRDRSIDRCGNAALIGTAPPQEISVQESRTRTQAQNTAQDLVTWVGPA
jgi:hypothetical protein